MKTLFGLLAASALLCGGAVLTGCQSSGDSQGSSMSHSPTAGGNGEFGESPAKPGNYSGGTTTQGGSAAGSAGTATGGGK